MSLHVPHPVLRHISASTASGSKQSHISQRAHNTPHRHKPRQRIPRSHLCQHSPSPHRVSAKGHRAGCKASAPPSCAEPPPPPTPPKGPGKLHGKEKVQATTSPDLSQPAQFAAFILLTGRSQQDRKYSVPHLWLSRVLKTEDVYTLTSPCATPHAL